jgi:conjugal transfer pilus assembly protein TraF
MERFDVKMTPYVILIYRSSKDHFPVALGVSTLEEIEDRIFRGIRLLSGEVNPESYALYDFQKGGRLDPSSYGTGDTGSDQ